MPCFLTSLQQFSMLWFILRRGLWLISGFQEKSSVTKSWIKYHSRLLNMAFKYSCLLRMGIFFSKYPKAIGLNSSNLLSLMFYLMLWLSTVIFYAIDCGISRSLQTQRPRGSSTTTLWPLQNICYIVQPFVNLYLKFFFCNWLRIFYDCEVFQVVAPYKQIQFKEPFGFESSCHLSTTHC